GLALLRLGNGRAGLHEQFASRGGTMRGISGEREGFQRRQQLRRGGDQALIVMDGRQPLGNFEHLPFVTLERIARALFLPRPMPRSRRVLAHGLVLLRVAARAIARDFDAVALGEDGVTGGGVPGGRCDALRGAAVAVARVLPGRVLVAAPLAVRADGDVVRVEETDVAQLGGRLAGAGLALLRRRDELRGADRAILRPRVVPFRLPRAIPAGMLPAAPRPVPAIPARLQKLAGGLRALAREFHPHPPP